MQEVTPIVLSAADAILQDILVNGFQTLYNLIAKHLPNNDHKTAATIMLDYVAQSVVKSIKTNAESVAATQVAPAVAPAVAPPVAA